MDIESPARISKQLHTDHNGKSTKENRGFIQN